VENYLLERKLSEESRDLLNRSEFGDIHAGDTVIRTAYLAAVMRLADKISNTLNYCRTVAERTSDLRIRQNKVLIKEWD
jgi:hypothetical protein